MRFSAENAPSRKKPVTNCHQAMFVVEAGSPTNCSRTPHIGVALQRVPSGGKAFPFLPNWEFIDEKQTNGVFKGTMSKTIVILGCAATISTTVRGASLTQLWQVDLNPTSTGGVPQVAPTFGIDGSVAVSPAPYAPNFATKWITSSGQVVLSLTNSPTVLLVSDQALLVSTIATLTYYELQAGQVVRQDFPIAGPYAHLSPVSSHTPPAARIVVYGTNGILTCYALDNSQFTQQTVTNRLSIPTITTNGLTVSTVDSGASTITLQTSTNLTTWKSIITVNAPKPFESLTIPLQGQPNLFLRLTGQ
jgi:hypothetical protein